MRRDHVLQTAENALGTTRGLALPVLQHFLDHLTLQVFLGAAEVARDDRKLLEVRIGLDVFFVAVGQRADHHVAAIVGAQFWRHGLERPVEEHVQEKRLDNVVTMVAERHFGRADFVGEGIERAATQARAQRAGGLALRNQLLDHRVSVFLDNVVLDAQLFEVGRQHVLREARLLLIHVHRHDLELDRRHLLQVHQHIEHGVAVLATGQADHDFVTVFNHVEVGNCLTGLTAKALLQFVLVDRKSAHDAKSVRCDERPAFYAKTLRWRRPSGPMWPASQLPPRKFGPAQTLRRLRHAFTARFALIPLLPQGKLLPILRHKVAFISRPVTYLANLARKRSTGGRR